MQIRPSCSNTACSLDPLTHSYSLHLTTSDSRTQGEFQWRAWGGSSTKPCFEEQVQELRGRRVQRGGPLRGVLISYDSDGGWVRGGINGGAGVPPPRGNGGDGDGQQRYIGGHSSGDDSGGGNSCGGNGDNGDNGVGIGGGDDGYAPVAGGSGPPPNWVVEEQQDGGNYAEDGSGPLAATFGMPQDYSADDSIIFPTLGPGLHVLAHPSRHRHALLALSKGCIDGA